jgi:hypothetical protein
MIFLKKMVLKSQKQFFYKYILNLFTEIVVFYFFEFLLYLCRVYKTIAKFYDYVQ